jgi:hypothetical protein
MHYAKSKTHVQKRSELIGDAHHHDADVVRANPILKLHFAPFARAKHDNHLLGPKALKRAKFSLWTLETSAKGWQQAYFTWNYFISFVARL